MSTLPPPAADAPDWQPHAWRMCRDQLLGRGLADDAVIEAMRRVPRHRFAPGIPADRAYTDDAMPIGHGQTISQPFMVAKMTQLLDPRPGQAVLEIGTGSGYQAAVLLELGVRLTTVERVEPLTQQARTVLRELYPDATLEVVEGDGTRGHEAGAPYDRILVTAGAPAVPDELKTQLADAGRLVIPTGPRHGQVLHIIERRGDRFTAQDDLGCRFVPLIGEDGWQPGQ